MGMAAFYLAFYSHQRTSTGFPRLPNSSLAGHVQVLGKVARSYRLALPTAPQSTPVLLSRHRLQCGAESSTATASLLINGDSSAPLLIMQELPVSGGAPQQNLHCFCISDTASAAVMGFHADKAIWLFVILKGHLSSA